MFLEEEEGEKATVGSSPGSLPVGGETAASWTCWGKGSIDGMRGPFKQRTPWGKVGRECYDGKKWTRLGVLCGHSQGR